MNQDNLVDPKEASAYAKAKARRDAQAPNIARGIVLVVVAMLAALIYWASVTEIREVARAEGEITPRKPLAGVEHREGGTITQLHVAPGDVVEAGQKIAELSDTQLKNELDQLAIRSQTLKADIARYKAMLEDLPADVPIPAGPGAESEQLQLAAAQRANFMARRASQAKRIRQLAESVRLSSTMRDNAHRRHTLAVERETVFRKLAEKGVVSQADYANKMAETQLMESELNAAENGYVRARADYQDAQSTYEEIILDSRETNLEGLTQAQAELAQVERQVEDVMRRIDGLVLRAPISGIVQHVDSSQSEVLEPGASVARILPTGHDLVAEIRLSPRDVGHVAVRDTVVVRVTTFDQKRFGNLDGIVEDVSATTEVGTDQVPFYRVTVRLDRNGVGEGSMARPLRAGMVANAEILTDSRTIAEYLLKPVHTTLNASLGER